MPEHPFRGASPADAGTLRPACIVGLLFTVLTAAEPIRLAAPQLQCAAIDGAKAQFFSDYFAQELAATGLRVTTRAEILAVVGLERQKQLLGCSEDATSCLTELAGALGVEAIVTGSVAKTEGAASPSR